MKKWISFGLIIVVLVLNISITAQEEYWSEYSDEYLTIAKNVLTDLQLWKDFNLDSDYITRGEVTVYACMLLDLYDTIEDVSTEIKSPFPDVEISHWAYDYIRICNEIGIIHGDENRDIRPDDYCTYSEFVKIIVATLGWGNYAFGHPDGYPNGFFDVADKLGIYPLPKNNKDSFVTKYDAIIFLYNAIKKPMIIQKFYGDSPFQQSGSVTKEIKKIMQIRGYAKKINDDSISIDKKIYQLNEEQSNFTEGLVLCLYKYDEETDISTVLFLYSISDLNFDYEQPVSSDLPKRF